MGLVRRRRRGKIELAGGLGNRGRTKYILLAVVRVLAPKLLLQILSWLRQNLRKHVHYRLQLLNYFYLVGVALVLHFRDGPQQLAEKTLYGKVV